MLGAPSRPLLGRELRTLARSTLAGDTATMLFLRLARLVWLGHVSKIESRHAEIQHSVRVSQFWTCRAYSERMTIMDAPTFTLGELMKKARLDAGLDQHAIAAKLGIARTSVSNYETNRSEPPASVFVGWADVTGVPLTWLATGCTPRDLNPEPTDYESAVDFLLWSLELEPTWEKALREWQERVGAKSRDSGTES